MANFAIGQLVEITAASEELYKLGIMRSTAESLPGTIHKISDVRDYPPDKTQKMIYIGGEMRILWVLGSHVRITE